jgi:hypothetical protein
MEFEWSLILRKTILFPYKLIIKMDKTLACNKDSMYPNVAMSRGDPFRVSENWRHRLDLKKLLSGVSKKIKKLIKFKKIIEKIK